jgi:hypothetical protein
MVTVKIEGLEELEALAHRLTEAVRTIREAQTLLGGAPIIPTTPVHQAAAAPIALAEPTIATAQGPKRIEFTPEEFALRTALKAQNLENAG